jgi:tRNA threonylcarbamoyladenosine biosynthesis protein TsaB
VLLLSVDTCDSRGSVCAVCDGVPGSPAIHTSGEEYSAWLLPAIGRCVAEAGFALKQIDAFAVATGPGSFTGVRVGLTTVKGLAEAFNRPIGAVSRLLAIATMPPAPREWIAAVVDAGRSEVFAALYQRQNGLLVRHGDEIVGAPTDFFASVAQVVPGGGVLWSTPDPEVLTRESAWSSRAAIGDVIETLSPIFAPAIGLLGYQQFRRGDLVDALHLDANYIRRSDAEKFWKAARPAAHGS